MTAYRDSSTPHATSKQRAPRLLRFACGPIRSPEDSMVEAEGRTFAFESEEALTPGVLETFPYEYAGRDATVEISTDEWS